MCRTWRGFCRCDGGWRWVRGDPKSTPTDRSMDQKVGGRQRKHSRIFFQTPPDPKNTEKPRKTGVSPPPPVLYQHLKIVRGLFLDLIFRPKKGLSGPQKTHGRPLAPEVKLVFVFSFSFFRLCGACFRRFLGVGRVPKSWRQNKGI